MKLTRREVVTWIGVGAAVLQGTAFAADGQVASPLPSSENPFPGLERGRQLLGVWTIDAVHVPHEGAVAVHLSRDEHVFRLNVLKRDPAGVQGVGESRSLAVYVCNNGNGRRETDEIEGQAARALASWLDAFEAKGFPLPDLVTLREHARPGAGASNEI